MPEQDQTVLQWLLKADDKAIEQWALEATMTRNETALGRLIELYLLHGGRKQAHTSSHTLKAYRRGLTAFLHWCEAAPIDLLIPSRRDLVLYRTYLQQRPGQGQRGRALLTQSTVAAYLSVARTLYRALRWAGVLHSNLPEDVQSPMDPTRSVVKNPPYEQELEEALRLATPVARALLLLCAHGGLRVAEALATRRTDLRGQILDVKGKGGKARQVPLSARTRAALLALPLSNQNAYFDWNYNQAYYHMQTLFHEAGLQWRGFHAARKTAASRLYHQTHDFTRVAIFLGHSSVDTTRRYVKVDEDDVASEVEQW